MDGWLSPLHLIVALVVVGLLLGPERAGRLAGTAYRWFVAYRRVRGRLTVRGLAQYVVDAASAPAPSRPPVALALPAPPDEPRA